MPTTKLTQLTVERMRPPPAGRVEHFDTLLPALALRVSATGHKSWVLFYRVRGTQRRHTIGTLAQHPKLDDVRKEARRLLAAVAAGDDPRSEKQRDQANTMAAVAAEFIERYAKTKQRSWRDTERLLNKHIIPRWGERPIGEIRRRDVQLLLDELADEGLEAGRNRVLAWLRKLFNWAIERDLVEANPAAAVKPPARETRRDRVLSDAELRAFWAGCDRLGYPFGMLFQLLLLTAQRRDEIAGLRWDEIDEQRAVLALAPDRTKAGSGHSVPLSDDAMALLRAAPRTGRFVFSTRGPAVSGFSRAKQRLDELMGAAIPMIEPWTLHDLRRTGASGMARSGADRFVISRVLNHADRAVSGVYDRHSYEPQMRLALTSWATVLRQILA